MNDPYLDEPDIYHSNERRSERFEAWFWGFILLVLIGVVSFQIFGPH